MNIILLEDVRGLGKLGEQVKVKPGYGRNYLIPQGTAMAVNEGNLATLDAKRAELEAKAQTALTAATQRAETLEGMQVEIAMMASEEGKLYGSVGTREIAKAVSDAGFEIEKRDVRLPSGPLHSLGEFEVQIQIHGDVVANVNIAVVAQK